MVEDEFYGCKQGPHESDKNYLDRFVLAAQNLEQLGEEYAVSETQRFLTKLNVKHSEMVADLLNGVGGGMPQTADSGSVAAAYSKISSWVSGARAPEANGDTRVPTAFFVDESDERMNEEPDNAMWDREIMSERRPTFTGHRRVLCLRGKRGIRRKRTIAGNLSRIYFRLRNNI